MTGNDSAGDDPSAERSDVDVAETIDELVDRHDEAGDLPDALEADDERVTAYLDQRRQDDDPVHGHLLAALFREAGLEAVDYDRGTRVDVRAEPPALERVHAVAEQFGYRVDGLRGVTGLVSVQLVQEE